MARLFKRVACTLFISGCRAASGMAQRALTWPEARDLFESAVRVRETMRFSYKHGGASPLDFITAENDYRSVQLNYVNLIGSYLTAAPQLSLAVGREAIP